MASKRILRLNEQLKRELSDLIRTKVRDPRIGTVTLTAVEVAGDLASARVHVQLSGPESERASSLAGLQAAAPFLRRTLGASLHVRKVPELRFLEDHSLEHARRIEQLLSQNRPGPDPPQGDEE